MKNIKTFALLAIIILLSLSGCISQQNNAGIKSQNKIGPTKNPDINNEIEQSVNIGLEDYRNDFLSMKKPIGWDVKIAGSCENLGILVRDSSAPENQLFSFLEFGPLYLSAESKQNDINYVQSGGISESWIDMPVVDPFTPENFLKQFHNAAKTNWEKNYMEQMPEFENVDIISSESANANSNTIQGDTKIIRALFKQNGELSEGMFYVTTIPFPANHLGFGFFFTGISGDKDKFKYMEKALLESIGSMSISDQYANKCIQKQAENQKIYDSISKSLSTTSDIIANGWERRSQSEDILAQKESDVIMQRERVYDPADNKVYEVPLNYYEEYDKHRQDFRMNDLQKLPDSDWNLWESPTYSVNNIK